VTLTVSLCVFDIKYCKSERRSYINGIWLHGLFYFFLPVFLSCHISYQDSEEDLLQLPTLAPPLLPASDLIGLHTQTKASKVHCQTLTLPKIGSVFL